MMMTTRSQALACVVGMSQEAQCQQRISALRIPYEVCGLVDNSLFALLSYLAPKKMRLHCERGTI